MIFKDFNLMIDFDKSIKYNSISFVKGDFNTCRITFDVVQELTNLKMFVVFKMSDNTTYILEATIIDTNSAILVLPSGVLSVEGYVNCQVSLHDEVTLARLTNAVSFYYNVESDYSEDAIEASDTTPILTQLLADNLLIEDAEGLRVTAESNRVIAETTRNDAEVIRLTSEIDRETAEGLRVTAEQGRVTAEGLRDAAEGLRDSAEGLRVTTEEGRVTAEGLRDSAETARDDAEVIRIANDLNRVLKTDIVNGLTETIEGKVLDARQGKVLNDKITILENQRPLIYGVLFSGSVSAGTRTDDAVGMVANVGLNDSVVQNDFDEVPFFNRPACNVYFDANGNPIVMAYEGEPGFNRAGATFAPYAYPAECFYEETPFYWNGSLDNPRVTRWAYSDFILAPRFVDENQKEYSPCYGLAMVSGKATSRSGLQPEYCSVNTGMSNARTFHANGHTETIKARMTDYILQLVEFATRDQQTIMMGAANLRYNNAADVSVLAENGVNRIVVSAATAANYVVGQSISIGTASNGEQISARVVITSITDEGANKALNFGGSALNIPLGAFISSRAWINGATDAVVASSGSIGSNSSGFYPCKWRNKENPWANIFSAICDLLANNTNAELWYLPDPTKYANGVITADYIKMNYALPLSDGYVTDFEYDARFPFIRLPKILGASSTTFMGAYYYYPRYNPSAVICGGGFHNGRYCSPVCFDLYHTPSIVSVGRGTRLFVSRA